MAYFARSPQTDLEEKTNDIIFHWLVTVLSVVPERLANVCGSQFYYNKNVVSYQLTEHLGLMGQLIKVLQTKKKNNKNKRSEGFDHDPA